MTSAFWVIMLRSALADVVFVRSQCAVLALFSPNMLYDGRSRHESQYTLVHWEVNPHESGEDGAMPLRDGCLLKNLFTRCPTGQDKCKRKT